MNLRLDRESIRVRLSVDDLFTLAKDGQVSERFPLPGGKTLGLRVERCLESRLKLNIEDDCFYLFIPAESVDRLVSAVGNPVEKSALELREEFPDFKIQFEVDRFELKKNVRQMQRRGTSGS